MILMYVHMSWFVFFVVCSLHFMFSLRGEECGILSYVMYDVISLVYFCITD